MTKYQLQVTTLVLGKMIKYAIIVAVIYFAAQIAEEQNKIIRHEYTNQDGK